MENFEEPDQCVIAAITNDGKVVVPAGHTTFQEEDETLAVTHAEGAHQQAELLAPSGVEMKKAAV